MSKSGRAKKDDTTTKLPNNIDLSLIAEEYCQIREQELSKYSVRHLRYSLRVYFEEFQTEPDGNTEIDIKKLKQRVRKFLSGKGNEYYNKQLQDLRGFYKFCVDEEYLESNPCEGFKYKAHTQRIVQHSEAVIRKLLDAPDKTTWAGLRDYTAMVMFLDTGVRPSELLQIQIKDIDFQSGYIRLREQTTKSRQQRTVPLSGVCMTALKKLIHYRQPEWKTNILFCSWRGEQLSTDDLRLRFREYSKITGTTITPYHLRHTFALLFLKHAPPSGVFALQKIMGHKKLEQTRTYVNILDSDVRIAHDAASPISNMVGVSKKHTLLGKL